MVDGNLKGILETMRPRTRRPSLPVSSKLNTLEVHENKFVDLPVFEIVAKITVSARNKDEAERLVDSKLIRLESDVILKTERTETKEVPR